LLPAGKWVRNKSEDPVILPGIFVAYSIGHDQEETKPTLNCAVVVRLATRAAAVCWQRLFRVGL
jgi:hypothetical protein